MSDIPAKNTDRELFREDTSNPAGSYYENSIFVTEDQNIGMNVGGMVYCLPIETWHQLADLYIHGDPEFVKEPSIGGKVKWQEDVIPKQPKKRKFWFRKK